jgi:hypothetical protein
MKIVLAWQNPHQFACFVLAQAHRASQRHLRVFFIVVVVRDAVVAAHRITVAANALWLDGRRLWLKILDAVGRFHRRRRRRLALLGHSRRFHKATQWQCNDLLVCSTTTIRCFQLLSNTIELKKMGVSDKLNRMSTQLTLKPGTRNPRPPAQPPASMQPPTNMANNSANDSNVTRSANARY